MPIGWFICPYRTKLRPLSGDYFRYCAVDDFTALIYADNGYPGGNIRGAPAFWWESEILGGHAAVKVRASALTLSTLAAEPGFTRLPKAALTETQFSTTALSGTSSERNTAISNRNDSASIFVVGYFATNALTGPDETYITPTAMITAMIINSMSRAMPIAVTMESTENTRSITITCAIAHLNACLET